MIELHGIHHQWRDKVPQAIHDQLIVFGFRYQWEILICSLYSAALHPGRLHRIIRLSPIIPNASLLLLFCDQSIDHGEHHIKLTIPLHPDSFSNTDGGYLTVPMENSKLGDCYNVDQSARPLV